MDKLKYQVHDGHVNLKNGEGDVFALPEKEFLSRAKDSDWLNSVSLLSEDERKAYLRERELEEKYDNTTGQVLAGLAGAGRGLVPGFDWMMTNVGAADVDTLRALKEFHPTTSLVTEVGATVAPFVGPLNKALKSMAFAGKAVNTTTKVYGVGRESEQLLLRGLDQVSPEIAAPVANALGVDVSQLAVKKTATIGQQLGLDLASAASPEATKLAEQLGFQFGEAIGGSPRAAMLGEQMNLLDTGVGLTDDLMKPTIPILSEATPQMAGLLDEGGQRIVSEAAQGNLPMQLDELGRPFAGGPAGEQATLQLGGSQLEMFPTQPAARMVEAGSVPVTPLSKASMANAEQLNLPGVPQTGIARDAFEGAKDLLGLSSEAEALVQPSKYLEAAKIAGMGAGQSTYAALGSETSEATLYDTPFELEDIASAAAFGAAFNLAGAGLVRLAGKIGKGVKGPLARLSGNVAAEADDISEKLREVEVKMVNAPASIQSDIMAGRQLADDAVSTLRRDLIETTTQYDNVIAKNSALRNEIRSTLYRGGAVGNEDRMLRGLMEEEQAALLKRKNVFRSTLGDEAFARLDTKAKDIVEKYYNLKVSQARVTVELANASETTMGASSAYNRLGVMRGLDYNIGDDMSMLLMGAVGSYIFDGIGGFVGGAISGKIMRQIGSRFIAPLLKPYVMPAVKGAGLIVKMGGAKLLTHDDIEEIREELGQVVPPELQMEHLTNSGLPPDRAADIVAQNGNVHSFLAAKLPATTGFAERAKFSRYVDAVSNGAGIFDRLSRLEMTHEDVEVLETFAPAALAQARSIIKKQMKTNEKSVKFTAVQRQQQELFIGEKKGISGASIQKAFQSKQEQPQGVKSPNFSGMQATKMDKIQGG